MNSSRSYTAKLSLLPLRLTNSPLGSFRFIAEDALTSSEHSFLTGAGAKSVSQKAAVFSVFLSSVKVSCMPAMRYQYADQVKRDSLALRGLRPAEIFCAAEAGSPAAVSEAPLSDGGRLFWESVFQHEAAPPKISTLRMAGGLQCSGVTCEALRGDEAPLADRAGISEVSASLELSRQSRVAGMSRCWMQQGTTQGPCAKIGS